MAFKKNSLKILFVGSLPPPTGGDAIWLDSFITNKLIKKNFDIKIVNTSLIGTRSIDLNSRYKIGDELVRTFRILINTLFFVIFFRPSIIHLNSNCSPLGIIRDFFVVCIGRLFCIPLIFHCHSNISDSIKYSTISIHLLSLCLSFSSKVFVLNQASQNYCMKIASIDSIVIPNFINYYDVIFSKSIAKNVSNIIFVGHLIKKKGVLEIIELARNFPNFNFILAGSLTSDIILEGLPINIKIKGNLERSKIIELLNISDIFIFPTHTEGFSMALLEAMGNGLPVITTNVGANLEMLENKGGLIVSVSSISDLIVALNKLKCPTLREEMSLWNIKKVKNNYTDIVVIRNIIDLYISLIKKT